MEPIKRRRRWWCKLWNHKYRGVTDTFRVGLAWYCSYCGSELNREEM